MRVETVHATSSSPGSSLERPLLHEDKQGLHEQWWIMTLFTALLPFGMSLAISFKPLEEMLRHDSAWIPSFSEIDTSLLDGAMLIPSIIVPTFIGMALDVSWPINLGLLVSLIGSVMGAFFVAMGFAWYSFGLGLTGRVISGFSFGSLLVVCDVIACQFNRSRKATTLGCIAAVKTFAIYLNNFWIRGFTIESLGGDHEKMDDILLISTLLCLGVGFLWSPLIESFDMDDAVKQRRTLWKWHISKPCVVLAVSTGIAGLLSANLFFDPPIESRSIVLSTIILGPFLGWWLDMTERSQDGSPWVIGLMVASTWLLLLGQMLSYVGEVDIGLSGIALGVMPMLLRLGVPQVSSRDNIGSSFGLVEGASFLAATFTQDSAPLAFITQLILIAVLLFLLTFISYRVREKWSLVVPPVEPVHVRGA
jgi:MFS family permease